MSRTMTTHADVDAQPPAVGGLRLVGQQRLYLFEALTDRGRKRELTIGRDEACDIWLSHPTVSALHGAILFARDSWEPVFLLRDRASKNGIRVSIHGPRGPFLRIIDVRLRVGLHVRIGEVTLVAVDRQGACPIVATSEAEFLVQARALYGSDQATARFLGVSIARIRQLLARLSARGARP
jgi:hypothetical protein